jgi:hypothetical protein
MASVEGKMSEKLVKKEESTVKFVENCKITYSDGTFATYTGEMLGDKLHGSGTLK